MNDRMVLARRLKAALVVFALVALAASLVACGDSEPKGTEDERTGFGMGGVDQDVVLSRAVVENEPEPWVLNTPEEAVRSYLDWVSYAYRIGDSNVATPTMSPYQVVRVDAYNQNNLQKERLLDQQLESLEFGQADIQEATAVLPAKEKWSYRYVSIKEADATLEGPYTAEYETTYHLTKTDVGWVVDNIDVKAIGEVK